MPDAPKEGWVYPTSRFVAAEDEIGMMYSSPRHEGEEVHYVRGDEHQRHRDLLTEALKDALDVLSWASKRLDVDGGKTEKEQKETRYQLEMAIRRNEQLVPGGVLLDPSYADIADRIGAMPTRSFTAGDTS